MRRRVITILLLLVLGAVSTVAVAWACAWWADIGRSDIGGMSLEAPWFVTRNDSLGVTWVESGGTLKLADLDRVIAATEDVIPAWAERQLLLDDDQRLFASGWPPRAVECRVDGSLSESQLIGGFQPPSRAAAPLGAPRIPAIPYRPIWSGFALDTLLYAALLWLLFFAPRTARRVYRARRGRCRKCGYPVGASPACSECGALVRAVSE